MSKRREDGSAEYSENEIRSIVEDEIHRTAIRGMLQKERSRQGVWSVIWEAANSKFVLWFVSSVVIAYGSFLYSNWSDAKAKERDSRQYFVRLQTEVLYRLDLDLDRAATADKLDQSFITMMCQRPSDQNLSENSNPFQLDVARNQLVFEPGRFIFPELKERNMFSLLWELERKAPSSLKQSVSDLHKYLKDTRKKTKEGASVDTDQFIDTVRGYTRQWVSS